FKISGSRQLFITTFSVPSSVEKGSHANLQCQYRLDPSDGNYEPYVKWWWTPLYGTDENRDRVQLYQRLQKNDSQTLNKHNIVHLESDSILVTDLDFIDSGIYECEVSGLTEIRVHKQLIVYSNGTGPQLNISEVADGPDADSEADVLLECAAQDVSPQPELSLSVNGKELDNVTTHVVNTSEGSYTIVTNVTVSKDEVDGTEVRCELFYTNQDISHPPYIDAELYDPSGAVTAATETLEVDTPPASHSLQDERSNSSGHRTSWLLLALATIPLYLRALL
ncbi:uncharacterized protein LOC131842034, partial [Achroia grisella]|uniref:uncharacterized protein LOC131842034 n=1 Tax=Achroia grisella TaxID=688607 RepID=UPI0027D2CDFF